MKIETIHESSGYTLIFEKPLKFMFMISSLMLGTIVRRTSSYISCSVKTTIPDQIIDVNSRYNYKIQAKEVFNGDISYIYATKTGSTALPYWLVCGSFVSTTDGAIGVSIQASIAYVSVGAGGLQIINITNPSKAKTLSNIPTTGDYVRSVTIEGSLAYVAAGTSGLQIINIGSSKIVDSTVI